MPSKRRPPTEVLVTPGGIAEGDGPFTTLRLNEIFAKAERFPDRVSSRENTHLEFKANYSGGSLGKYARTMAAFANASGGYLVFGITNSPHRLEGLKDLRFDESDPTNLTKYLNEHLAPEIRWEKYIHSLDEKNFGLIYTFSAKHKPVICSKNSAQERGDTKPSMKEGEIYYRYRGNTEIIRYSELRRIIEDVRKEEQSLWMGHLKRIARIGVKNAGIYDVNAGTVSGPGGTFVIDQKLIPQLTFIQEGNFVERDGSPTLKLIGTVTPAESSLLPNTKLIIETRTIRSADIINAFLDNDKVDRPLDFVRQICHESSAFFPVYHFLCLANYGQELAVALINGEITSQPAKIKLLERLTNDRSLSNAVASKVTPSSAKKIEFLNALNQGTVHAEELGQSEVKQALAALRMLDRNKVNAHYIRLLLKCWFVKFYGKRGPDLLNLDDDLRRAICFLDAALNVNTFRHN